MEEYVDHSMVPVCFTQVDTLWSALFFVLSISLFYFVPLVILIKLYVVIAKTLMKHPNIIAPPPKNNAATCCWSVIKYRKQVVLMLGTVVLAFFICLLPFRVFALWIVIGSPSVMELGFEGYYNLLYIFRIMFYLNSAVNPILYNIMSTKFRTGFLKLCGVKKKRKKYRTKADIARNNTFNTTSSSTQTSSHNTSDSFWSRNTSRKSSSSKEHRRDSLCMSESVRNNNERSNKETMVRAHMLTLNPIKAKFINGESYV